jgi:hypothetical protein
MRVAIGVFVAVFLLLPRCFAFDLPWSDAAKYRTECRRSCIDSSFGKGRAPEIVMRCSARCDHLPLSPEEQWGDYDHCEALNKKHRDFYAKNAGLITRCEQAQELRLQECRTRYGRKDNAKPRGRYVPGAIADKYMRDLDLEECEKDAKLLSPECSQISQEKFAVDILSSPSECKKPSVARPR